MYEEAAAVRRLLSGDSTPGDFPPSGLAERIKRAAREAHDDAQIRSGAAVTPIGSPAFVAVCASLMIGAFMFYAVTTQVYERHLDARIAAEAATSVDVATLPRGVVHAVPPSPQAVAPQPAVLLAAVPSAPTATVLIPATTPRTRRPEATPTVVSVQRPRVGRVSAQSRPQVAPRRSVAVAVVARLAAPAVATVTPRRAPASAPAPTAPVVGDVAERHDEPAATPGLQGVRLAMVTDAPASSASDDTSAGLAAGLVARYVVERYVAESLAQAAPALTMAVSMQPVSYSSAQNGPMH
jgi:hypothetical protein